MSDESSDLVAFLLERLDEDHKEAHGVAPGATRPWAYMTLVGYDDEGFGTLTIDAGRARAEVEAKRRIVEEIVPKVDSYDDQITSEWGGPNDETADYLLRLLALPYASHPGYRSEWRPA